MVNLQELFRFYYVCDGTTIYPLRRGYTRLWCHDRIHPLGVSWYYEGVYHVPNRLVPETLAYREVEGDRNLTFSLYNV
jgi:hypothetical protein